MGEKQPDDVVKYYLESLLELMVNQVIIINVFIYLVYNKVFREIRKNKNKNNNDYLHIN